MAMVLSSRLATELVAASTGAHCSSTFVMNTQAELIQAVRDFQGGVLGWSRCDLQKRKARRANLAGFVTLKRCFVSAVSVV